MPSDSTAFALICLAFAITFACRMSGAVIMSRIAVSARGERFLDHLSTCIVAAMVASIVAQNGMRQGLAVALAGAIMLKSKSAVWSMVGGMVLAAIWTFFASSS